MPTMPERMAVVETKVSTIEKTVSGIDGKVDQLLEWQVEERTRRAEKDKASKRRNAALAGIAGALGALGSALFNFVLGAPRQ